MCHKLILRNYPSCAYSIRWYDWWIERRNEKVKQRILDYNDDDCVAMRVLVEGLGVDGMIINGIFDS